MNTLKMLKVYLNKDLSILDRRMKEFEDISNKLKEKSSRFRMSNDLAIVANAQEVFELQRKVKNNNFEGKRLELDDEDPLLETQKTDQQMDITNYYKPRNKSHGSPSKHNKENEENNGEHVFFVQLDSELPMPNFMINISKEKKKIESIGNIKSSFLSNQNLIEDTPESENTKMMTEMDTQMKNSNKFGYRKQHEDVKQFLEHYNGLSNSFRAKMTSDQNNINMYNLGFNKNVIDPSDVHNSVNPGEYKEETIIKSDMFLGRQMYWFKWDSFDTWKYNFEDDLWNLVEDAKPPHKFLYFSNTVHLK